jgi:hypothetical protein
MGIKEIGEWIKFESQKREGKGKEGRETTILVG